MAEAQNNDMNHAILNLTAQEKSAYSYLFKLADTDSIGVLTGERAVTFFEKTRVPAPVLGEIWQIADTENRGLLTKPGFCMVMRLVANYQAGEQPRAELAFKPAAIPRFDGITVPGAELPPTPASPTRGQTPVGALQPQLSGQSTGGGPVRIPPLDAAKVQQYSGLFERSGAQNGILDGVTAKGIFDRSGLPNEVLGKIWMLSDREQRGALDQTEFVVAMHLLTSMKARAMTGLPATLPPALYEAAARRGQRPPSRQMTGPPAGVIPRQVSGPPLRAQSPLARSTPPAQSMIAPGPHWLVTAQEKAQYDRFFSAIDTSGTGIISGEQAVAFFSDSRLPDMTLASIWDLADINSEGQLNRDEFAVAMYLIKQQRQPNAPALPAFLPPSLIPPSMRAQHPQQQTQQSTAPAFDNPTAAPPSNVPKSAAEDLFGLDEPPQPLQQPIALQTTGPSTSRDPFAGSQPGSPGSPQRFQAQITGTSSTTFKPFIPTSAFGASLTSQNTGTPVSPSPGARAIPPPQQAPPQTFSGMDDLLGDNETSTQESNKLTGETTELANMSSQIGNLRTQMEQTQNKKSATQAELSAVSTQKQDLEVRLQQFRAQYEAEVRTVKELEQQLTASKDSTKKLGQDLAMLEGTYQDLQTQHNQVSQALQADQQENAGLKQKISQVNSEVARLKPEIEKLKLDARQQKGLASINKKQLTTVEGERDRLTSEKSELEREAAESASAARDVVSPAASTMSTTNPFFRKPSDSTVPSPPAQGSSGPTPSAFDALFGPSSAFAPSGQASSRSATPPATSFIGRSLPSASTAASAAGGVLAGAAAAVGLGSVFDSSRSADNSTPVATPPSTDRSGPSAFDSVATPMQEPPPPPASRQFTASHLPITSLSGGEGSEAASSLNAIPPASRAGTFDVASATPTPAAPELDTIPGAFPDEEPQTIAPRTTDVVASSEPTDFDTAFASFGNAQTSSEARPQDKFFENVSRQPPQASGFDREFPPIENLERDDDDDDDSDSEAGDRHGGFEDNFNAAPPPAANGTMAAASTAVSVSAIRSDVQPAAAELPSIDQQQSPPTYEETRKESMSGDKPDPNQFPPEFEGLLPAREDPTSFPPPNDAPTSETPRPFGTSITQSAFEPPQSASLAPASHPFAAADVTTPTADVFHDASSRPPSNITSVTATPIYQPNSFITSTTAAPKNAFDDFDDFEDLSEAREADKTNSDGFDMDFSRASVDEFNPAFDSPAASMTNTPMARSMQQSQDSSSNGFAGFTPSASMNMSAFGTASTGSIQQTPQSSQQDWDAIFSGLDSSRNLDTSFPTSDSDPWASAPVTTSANGNTTFPGPPKVAAGTAVTPGTEHDDPILKRLTGMGYPRGDALNALEMHDYDIGRAVDHLTGG